METLEGEGIRRHKFTRLVGFGNLTEGSVIVHSDKEVRGSTQQRYIKKSSPTTWLIKIFLIYLHHNRKPQDKK